MKTRAKIPLPRALAALLIAILMMSLCFAGTTTDTVLVANASELSTALNDAATSGNATIIRYSAGTSSIEISAYTAIPSNVTLDLSTGGGALLVSSGGVLDVAGTISGGAVEVSGGTLLREFGSSITATITTSSSGVVRGARILSLENLSTTSTESITAVSYAGETSADTSVYVTRAATAVLYVKMTGSNYSSYKVIETVATSADNVFRLGTKYTDTLSLSYSLTYGGLSGASLSVLNPVRYTASDSSILLNNPTKDGFLFAGWTCEQLGVSAPQDEMVIPEGTTGELTFIAIWVEAPAGGKGAGSGGSGGSSSASSTDQDAEEQQADAAAQDQAATAQTQQSSRRTRTASSSTKVTFTSDVEAEVPTVQSATSGSASSPWIWVFGGLGILGIIAYIAAKLVNRRAR